MIDMHSHILPGIDDGAQEVPEALLMLQKAAEHGVKIQVLTPHIQIGRYDNTLKSLQTEFTRFEGLVQEKELNIQVRLAAEIRIGPEILPLVQTNAIPWLGTWQGQRVMLMEFPHNQVPVGAMNLVQWLLKHEALPMIAHPERNRELQENMQKLMPFVEAGCLVQVTAGSLTGGFGAQAHRCAVELLRAGQVTLLATDCHNMKYRPPDLNEGAKAATEIVGESAAWDLVHSNPSTLLSLS